MKRKQMWRYTAAATVCVMLFAGGCGNSDQPYQKAMELALEEKYTEALTCFEEAVSENGSGEEYIGYGMTLYRAGEYSEAETVVQEALEALKDELSDEESRQLYYILALAQYGSASYDDAIANCDQALSYECLEDMDADLHYTKAVVLHLQGNLEQAKEECQKVLEEQDDYQDAYTELAGIERDLGSQDAVIEVYQDAVRADDSNYDASLALAEAYQENGQDSAAQELLQKLLELKEDDAENLLVMGRAAAALGEYDSAEEYYEKAYQEGQKEALYYQGVMQYAREQEDTSSQDGSEALSLFEDYLQEKDLLHTAGAYYYLASLYMDEEQYEDAQSMLTKGLACNDTECLRGLRKTQVILYERCGKFKKAKKAAKAYIRAYPSDQEMEKELSFIRTRI
ncbi:MAG: tetratricopeptide repeat protein [Clostridiaceae bacterium]|nr:tetratricopeptide repeat protein [Clostridiaceae bacterium]